MPITNKALSYIWITDNNDNTGDSLSHANTTGHYRPIRWKIGEGLKIGHDCFRSQCLIFVFQTPHYVKFYSMETVLLMQSSYLNINESRIINVYKHPHFLILVRSDVK
jgi:hypothetical protein